MRLSVVMAAFSACLGITSAAEDSELIYVPDTTRKVCQLTGDTDRATGAATLSQTARRFGVIGTDLGSSFEHKGKLYFLFGDTAGRPGDEDAIAWTNSTDPEKISLDFHQRNDGKWLAPSVPGIKLGAFEIPSGGCSIDGIIYVAFTTGHTKDVAMGRSVMASSHDDGRSFKLLYDLSRGKFINVSFLRADEWMYIYGSGEYRKSSVHLARVKITEIADPVKLQYFAGTDPNAQPRWVSAEAEALPLFHHDVVGEFSVAYLGPVKRYVMLYNSEKPSGIVMRSSTTPWGQWSGTAVVFDKWRDNGYGNFIHVPPKYEKKPDGLSDPNRHEEWGGAYGPYIMARFASGAAGQCRMYYTMSTWNPYQVVVMRSDLELIEKKK